MRKKAGSRQKAHGHRKKKIKSQISSTKLFTLLNISNIGVIGLFTKIIFGIQDVTPCKMI